MKTALLAVVGLVGSLAAPTLARAGETRADRETDHLDAFDDGGPRTFGLLFNAGALALGTLAVEGDLALGDAAALSLEADVVSGGGAIAFGAMVGVPLFPWRILFHGLYLQPRALLARTTGEGVSSDLFGMGGTLGWQQTWRFGLTLRVGGGAAYEMALAQVGPTTVSLAGVRPLVDGAVGWVF